VNPLRWPFWLIGFLFGWYIRGCVWVGQAITAGGKASGALK